MYLYKITRNNVFPSFKIEFVWFTHMEFTEDYRNFSLSLFGTVEYPNDYHLMESDEVNSDIIDDYK
jgi:hypothetical protein